MLQPIGYLKLYRELFTKPIWLKSTPEQKSVLMTLLAMAWFKPNEWEWKGEKFSTKEGQFVTSLESIRVDSGKGISIQNVRSSLKRFEKLGFLTNKSTKEGRLVTIVNWGLYQSDEDNPTKQPTKTQQRPNKDPTPKEEGKKDNKEIKDKYLLDSYEYKVADYLYQKILSRNENFKQPNMQTWSTHIDYMLRIDKRDLKEIGQVIDYCQSDTFWQNNILSTKKLREKYDQLTMRMNQVKPIKQTQGMTALQEYAERHGIA